MKTALLLAAAVLLAPMQCASKADPSLRHEDTPGDALWDLSEDFRAKGNTAAADDTLRFLLEKYPSSRFASAAREKLGGKAAPPPPAPSASASGRPDGG